MEVSWENWFSHLGMDGFATISCETESGSHSLYPSPGIQNNAAATVDGVVSATTAISGLSFDEIGFNGQSSHSWNAVPAAISSWKTSHQQLARFSPHLSSKRALGSHGLEPRANRGTKKARSSSGAQDRMMSERKRRHEMAERYMALSAAIPGLKKLDKASVLREAINYVKQLEERKALLEKETEKKSIKSLIINKSYFCSASCETNFNDCYGSNEVLPEVEVEARGLEKEVLIRIHCEKRQGIMLKLLARLENSHLSITSSSILPFGNSTLNITIAAQMDEEFNLTMNDLVKTLKHDLLKLYDMQL